MLPPETARKTAREKLRLIEAATAPTAAMQGDRHDKQGLGQVSYFEDTGGQQCAKARSDGFDAIVFEQMEKLAEFILIDAPGHGEREGRLGHAADAAECFRSGGSGDEIDAEVLSAAGAERTGLGLEVIPAGSADGGCS